MGFIGVLYGSYMGDLYGIYPPVFQHDWEIPDLNGGFHMKINGDCPLPGLMEDICWSFTWSSQMIGYKINCVFVPMQTKINDVVKKCLKKTKHDIHHV